MSKEQLAQKIMIECKKNNEPVSLEEALEMAEMELKSKKNCKHYETDKTQRKSAKREKKIDEEKLRLIQLLNYCLLEPNYIDTELSFQITNVSIVNSQKEIVFNVGANDYSLTLTKHRSPKIDKT